MMTAAVLTGWKSPLVVKRVQRPECRAGEILIEVKATALDAFDVTISDGRMRDQTALPQPQDPPLILGHEFAGVVAALGAGVNQVSIGDRIAVYPLLTCGRCLPCLSGHENRCSEFRGYVGVNIDGGLAQYARVPARNAIPLSPGVTDTQGAFVPGALGTAYHAVMKRLGVLPTDTVAIVAAAGGVGIHAVQLAKRSGARVIGIDVDDARLARVAELGADHVVNARDVDVVEAVRELTGGRGADKVLDIVGTDITLLHSFTALARGGRLCVMGGAPGARLALDSIAILQKEAEIVGTLGTTRADLTEVVELLERGAVSAVLSETHPLSEAPAILARVNAHDVFSRIVLVP
ncbi:alcohol dehydrogenase catalytic domain-containing protein [Kribbella sp. VKM Ac-2566]|uniref:alcohol dehydrogenase catalytic domain-containing protein n=1 Tax=Kribbella sp. VKM Ac-2566 TaxID=2512218 RepID=UPI0010EFFFA5|nr:zinc-binding dehydrogenase [Kribbella sp. VKM Ac-2566]TDX08272.1 propanol-preferring alcohol dehydrogenase [Kribbella sp. VKM Ac-2566]